MSLHDYYVMMLQEARKAHSFHIREARKWRYFLRDACMADAQADRRFARRCINIIREARHAN